MKRSESTSAAVDGRRLRSARSRQRIADALYELIGEGDLEPSAQSVADRAGVGVRSVFRLFSDMDALYATINTRIERDVEPMIVDAPVEGVPIGERTESMLNARIAVFERFGPYMRATHRHRERSEYLAVGSRRVVLRLRERLMYWIPELRSAPAEVVEALDQATSFEAWDRLRFDQRLSRPRALAAMRCAARALIAELEGAG